MKFCYLIKACEYEATPKRVWVNGY